MYNIYFILPWYEIDNAEPIYEIDNAEPIWYFWYNIVTLFIIYPW